MAIPGLWLLEKGIGLLGKIVSAVNDIDDILIAGNSKEDLKRIYLLLNDYARRILALELKPPVFRASKIGQVFLGYRVKPFRCELSGRSKK